MYCGQCCVTEARLRAAPQLDIFIEILLRGSVNNAYPSVRIHQNPKGRRNGRKREQSLSLLAGTPSWQT
jgi:hypothetical protein